jgi:asparagine synthase (glutamine-hydrolysing)
MNAIFGIFHTSGAPLLKQGMQAMSAALQHRAIDGIHHLTNGSAALGCAWLTITPEDEGAVQPAKSRDGRFIITADVRLDNRMDLARTFEMSPSEAGWPDHEYLLRAWVKWGTAAPEHLEGDFAFAVWDSQERCLHCVTSHLGGRAFYYWEGAGKFVFASEIKAVRAVPGVPTEPDLGMLAGLGDPLHSLQNRERTFYRDIRAMPTASVMTVSPDTRRTRTYWAPSRHRQYRFKDEAECLEQMRELIFSSVKARLRTSRPPICLLSGGLDSSTITGVAAKLLPTGQHLRTLSVTLRDPQNTEAGDERTYIDEFADWPNLERHFVHADGKGPFDDVERLIRNSEAPLATSRHFLYSEFAEQARNFGSRVILDGCFGEAGPSHHSHEALTEMFLGGQWLRMARELRAQSRLESVSVWTLLRLRILRPMVPPLLANRLGVAKRRDLVSILENSILRPEFFQKHTESTPGEITEGVAQASKPRLSIRDRLADGFDSIGTCHAQNAYNGYEHAELSCPFLDRRVIEFAMDAPVQLKLRDGYRRYLLRKSMDGILPRKIQWRIDKEPFSPDYIQRYNRQRGSVRAMLGKIRPTDPVRELVDIPRLQTLAESPMTSNRGVGLDNFAGLHLIPRGVFLITFLRQFEAFK